MPRISEMSLQNIRRFNSPQHARLGRITLLVGENSVGKSTFLGCFNAFAHLSNLVDLPDNHIFDQPPFSMGEYDSIARLGSSNFTITGQYDDHIHSSAMFSFGRDNKGRPYETRTEFSFAAKDASSAHIEMSIYNGDSSKNKRLVFHGPNFDFSMKWAEISFVPISTWLSRNVRHGFFPYNADSTIFAKRECVPSTSEEIINFGKFINFFRSEMPLPAHPSFHVKAPEPHAPPRLRSYKEPPVYLSNSSERSLIAQAGTALGLWSDITLTEIDLGEATDVLVTTAAGTHNLIDVGYGVHSILPFIHAIAVTDTPSIFLLQQPEVHVHPVAQAKLAQYMAEGPHDYIIETHSDHIVDRFRLCVLQQVLQPEDLVILYFENYEDNTETRIHNISVDSMGNVLDPPSTYREFFLTETERLLGLK